MVHKRYCLVGSVILAFFFTINAATVSGIVSDASSGKPIGSAFVTVSAVGGTNTFKDTTDTDGVYSVKVTASKYPANFMLVASVGNTSSNAVNILIATDTSTIQRNISIALPFAGVTVSGTVTDSLLGTPVKGAKIYLRRLLQNIDSAVSDQSGAYSIDSVARGQYSLVANAKGYVSKTVNNVAVQDSDVVQHILLRAIVPSTLLGKVTGDSANGIPLVNATVIVTRRVGTPFTDTVSTDANGWYVLTDLEAGISYSIAASMDGYTPAQVNNTQAPNADTVNFILARKPYGNMYIKVLKKSDSTAINGAAVVAVLQGTTLTANTNAGGTVLFDNINVGTYNLTVSAAGFTAGSTTSRVQNGATDSVSIYLVASVNGTKALKGIAKDSVSGVGLANALIVLTIQQSGQTILTFYDSTNASGNFFIEGIPTNRISGTVTALMTGYVTYTNTQVTLGQMNQSDTATLTIRMHPVTNTLPFPTPEAVALSKPEIRICGTILFINNAKSYGTVSIINSNGRLVCRRNIVSNTVSIDLTKVILARGVYIACINQKNSVSNTKFVIR